MMASRSCRRTDGSARSTRRGARLAQQTRQFLRGADRHTAQQAALQNGIVVHDRDRPELSSAAQSRNELSACFARAIHDDGFAVRGLADEQGPRQQPAADQHKACHHPEHDDCGGGHRNPCERLARLQDLHDQRDDADPEKDGDEYPVTVEADDVPVKSRLREKWNGNAKHQKPLSPAISACG